MSRWWTWGTLWTLSLVWCIGRLCGQRMLFRCIGRQLVAGPLGLVSTRFRWCCRWALCSAGVVRGKGTMLRIFLCRSTLQTLPARRRIDCWAKGCDWKHFSSAALKEDSPSSGRAGGIHCKIVLTCLSLQFKPSESCHSWCSEALSCGNTLVN